VHLSAHLTKITVEAALNAELEHHLGYTSHERKDRNSGNSRNGFSSKTLKGDHGTIELETPCDRNSALEPQIMVRDSLKYVSWKDYKAISADLKRIYQSATEYGACAEFDSFADK